jgi:hypothetical protein
VRLSNDVPGMLWRPRRVEAEAEAAARATVMRAKRIMKVRRVKFNEGVQQSAFCVGRKLKGELRWEQQPECDGGFIGFCSHGLGFQGRS